MERIGVAMQLYQGDGRFDGLTPGRLRKHAADLRGPPPDKKSKFGPPRWKIPATLVGVAALINQSGD
eukprot:2907806-Prymnesium_polylepis.1